VIGADNDGLHGVEALDMAVLEDRIGVYTNPGPIWQPLNVEVDGRNVLVIVVEPPRQGHRSWPLRKDAGTKYAAGAIFIRREAKTQPASPDEQDMLVARASPVAVEVGFEATVSTDKTQLIGLDLSEAALNGWLDERRRGYLRETAVHPYLHMPVDVFGRGAGDDDPRDLVAIRDEFQAYVDACWPVIADVAVKEFSNYDANTVQLDLENLSNDHQSSVIIELVVPDGVRVFDAKRGQEWRLKTGPWPHGTSASIMSGESSKPTTEMSWTMLVSFVMSW